MSPDNIIQTKYLSRPHFTTTLDSAKNIVDDSPSVSTPIKIIIVTQKQVYPQRHMPDQEMI